MTETGSRADVDADKREQAYRAAFDLFAKSPDWVTFFREIMGVGGVIRQLYPTPKELADFERSDTFATIQQMLGKLREHVAVGNGPLEPNRVITVRLPQSLHDALRVEAHEYRTSVNKLCISKLLQFIEDELVPEDRMPPRKKKEPSATQTDDEAAPDHTDQEDATTEPAEEGTGADL